MNIQLIFISKPQWEGGWPYVGYDNEELKNKIYKHMVEKFPLVNFQTNEIITDYDNDLIKQINQNILSIDGMVIFTIGHYGNPGIVEAGIELIKSGKPTILANIIYGGDHTFTKIYTSIKDENLPVYPISSINFEDFDNAIGVMSNLLQIIGNKILVYATDKVKMDWSRVFQLVTPERKNISKSTPEFLNQVGRLQGENFEFYFDEVGLDQAHQWRRDEKKYSENLKNIFGVEMIRKNPEDIIEYYDNVNDKEAIEELANKWINNANKIEPSKKTINNAAKLYFAFKKLFQDENIKFFAPDCGTLLLCGKMPAYPCMPFFELSNEGYYGFCESDLDSSISYIFGLYITGRPGFISNHTLDLINNRITYMHCIAANKLYGRDGPVAKYEIVYHGETGNLGASPRVIYPLGETLTTIKISVFEKKIAIRKGKIIDNPADKGGCVSKVLVEGNANKILENYDWETFGWHRVSFIGDWEESFRIGAKLLGLEIVEEDK